MSYKCMIRATLVLATCMALPARAALDCARAVSQGDMNSCAAADYGREDARLNSLYRQLVGMSDKPEIPKLKQIQTAWITFRDLHCHYEANRFQGGSIAPLVRFTCLRNLTRQRNETLQALIKDYQH